MAISKDYFIQIFQQLFHTNILTVVAVASLNYTGLHTFFDLVFESSTRKFWNTRGKKAQIVITSSTT